jgi:C-terminal processing protease CtpA/Prc
MMLRPYRTRQKPFTMDRSGLVVFAYGVDFNQFIVRDVIPESPAEKADIRPDDILQKIQGFPTHFYTLDGINTVLQKKIGKRIRMTILRDGKKLKKEFRLKDLV